MTKISFPALFKLSLKPYKHFLVFGNDQGVFRRTLSFLRHKIPYSLEEKTENEFLASLEYQHSLFTSAEEPSFILVHQVSDKVLPHLNKAADKYLIFTSEKARAHSKIVTHFASAPESLAISAYASPLSLDEFNSLSAHLSLSPSFKNQLVSLYQNDVDGLLSTLEKIKIYGELSESDYAYFLDPSPFLNDTKVLQEAFLLKDPSKIIYAFSRPLSSDSIVFLRALTRTFLILFDLLSHKKIIWEKLSFSLFFKERGMFEIALSLWNRKDTFLFLRSLLLLEKKVKHSAWSISEVHHYLLNQIVSRETI